MMNAKWLGFKNVRCELAFPLGEGAEQCEADEGEIMIVGHPQESSEVNYLNADKVVQRSDTERVREVTVQYAPCTH